MNVTSSPLQNVFQYGIIAVGKNISNLDFYGKKVVLSISEDHAEKLLHFPDPLLVPPVTYDVLDRWWTSLQKLERDPNSVCAFYLDAISGSHLFCPVKKDALPAADVGSM